MSNGGNSYIEGHVTHFPRNKEATLVALLCASFGCKCSLKMLHKRRSSTFIEIGGDSPCADCTSRGQSLCCIATFEKIVKTGVLLRDLLNYYRK